MNIPRVLRKEQIVYCPVCGTQIRAKQQGKGRLCAACTRKVTRIANKISIVQWLGGKCMRCERPFGDSITDYWMADLHHPNPETKRHTLGDYSQHISHEIKITEEWEVWCSNCHRLHHAQEPHPIIANDAIELAKKQLEKMQALAEKIFGPNEGDNSTGPVLAF